MNVVYKYRLMPGNPVVVTMPRLAKVLHVGSQDDGPVLWALVQTDVGGEEDRIFYVYGTGHPISEEVWTEVPYVGTCQTESGLVWHVFERPIERNIGALLLESAGIGRKAGESA